jgi:AraC-like DNA-binding protein
VGLDRAALADRDGFIPSVDFANLLEEAARATGDRCFGLHFGERFHPKDIGALTYVVLNSPTMAVGFANVARYLRVHNEAASVSFVRGQKWAYLRYALSDVPFKSRRQHEEYSMAVLLGGIRLMAGSEWSPVEVQFEHQTPPQTSEYTRLFGAPVSFGLHRNVFIMECEFCDREVPAADRRLYAVLERQLEHLLEGLPREDRLLTSVRRAIGESLRHGEPQLPQVANRVAIGARTLQRRLREAGVDFKALVDDTRHRLAARYLGQRKHTLTEVAYLLGYSEVSAFNRAFKRWTGSTPSNYRRGQTVARPSARGS